MKMNRSMKKPQVIALAVVAVMCLAVGGVVSAAGPAKGQGQGQGQAMTQDQAQYPGPGMRRGPWANMTEDQIKDIRTARENFRNETAELRRDIQIKKVEMRYLMQNPKIGQAEVIAKLKELQNLRNQMQEKRVAMMKDLQVKYPEMPMGRGFGKGFRRDGGRRGFGPGTCGGYGPRMGRGGYGRGQADFGPGMGRGMGRGGYGQGAGCWGPQNVGGFGPGNCPRW